MAALVSSYRVVLHHRTVRYGQHGSCWTMAQVRLFLPDDEQVTLVFFDEDKTQTAPTWDPAQANSLVFIPKDQYPWHLDLLRNEHPVYYVQEPGPWQGSLRTAEEPAGEGE